MAKIIMKALAGQQPVYGTYSGFIAPDVNGYAVIDARDFPNFTAAGFVAVVCVVYSSEPTTTNDANQGYNVGSLWIHSDLERVWICADNTVGSAVWILLYQLVKGS
jgi:hypothetical protein